VVCGVICGVGVLVLCCSLRLTAFCSLWLVVVFVVVFGFSSWGLSCVIVLHWLVDECVPAVMSGVSGLGFGWWYLCVVCLFGLLV